MKKYLIIFLAFFSFFLYIPVHAEEGIDDSVIMDESENESLVSNEYFYQNESTKYQAFIDDQANLLSDSEKHGLLDTMIDLTNYGHIAFVSVNDNYSSVESFADQYYHSHFSTESGSIFIIDMSNRKIYIFSDGNNYQIITSSKAYSITDNVYTYATDEEYYLCAKKSFQQISALLNGYKISEPMRYTSNIFIALTLSFLLSFIIILTKSKVKGASNSAIIKNCDINFKLGAVRAEKTGTHRVYSPVSDSSSGGSSGGGGGGGSSGGGGGHSF